ncbi:MAG: 4-hydroxybenzoate octaprenyltransferase [Gemmatimonas sp.]
MTHPTLKPQDGQLIQGGSLAVRLANFVKLPHTVFAMPFAMVGVVLASINHDITTVMVWWTIVAFTAARFAAMGFNRIVDRDIDAINPRTAMREIPSGALTLTQARVSVFIASLLFFVASSQLNSLCLMLSPIALAWVLGYSYTKRFTRWSHLWLGLGLSIAPVGGYLAVAGEWSTPWWLLCALATAVITWSGGFDIIYALQDADFDRKNGLRSIPSSIGVERAIWLARTLHVVAVLCLVMVSFGVPALGMPLVTTGVRAGIVLATLLLLWEHRLVHANDLSRINAAFFTMNGIISLTFFACVLVARLLAVAP